MTAIAVAPFVLKDVLFTVDADDYAKHVSSVQFVPSTSVVTWQGLSPAASFSDTTAPTWVCNVGYAQDWETDDSFSEYLLANSGEKKTVVFQPKAGSGQRAFTAEVYIVPGPIGGDVNTVQAGTVSLGVNGQPVPSTSA